MKKGYVLAAQVPNIVLLAAVGTKRAYYSNVNTTMRLREFTYLRETF